MAVPGVWPLVFTRLGYSGQINWLADIAVAMRKDSYDILLAAAKEGELEIPLYTTVRLLDKTVVYLGPMLTTPTEYHLKRTPSIHITTTEEKLIVSHTDWEEEEEEEVFADDMTEEEKEEDDGEEEQDFQPWKEGANQGKEEKKRRKRVHVGFDAKGVKKEELEKHFSQFGEVEDVFMVPPHHNFATVTFKSEVVAEFLIAKSGLEGKDGERRHSLQRPGAEGSPVQLRLLGGSGRGRRVPPRLQRHATCSFRSVIAFYSHFKISLSLALYSHFNLCLPSTFYSHFNIGPPLALYCH